jgi:hypothetical protein
MSIAVKKKKILAYIAKNLKPLDPAGNNIKRYTKMLGDMNDKQFDEFMKNMRDGNFQFHIIIPNLTPKSTMDEILQAADNVGLKLFHRIWFTDEATGKKYLSRAEYPVLELPIRRMQQFLDKKLSVPDSDQSIDGLTGQVTGKDRSASITNPEIQSLHSKGLSHTLNEMVTIRGGDISSYGELKRQMEEGGSAVLGAIEIASVTRTAIVTKILLEGMLLENNLIGDV